MKSFKYYSTIKAINSNTCLDCISVTWFAVASFYNLEHLADSVASASPWSTRLCVVNHLDGCNKDELRWTDSEEARSRSNKIKKSKQTKVKWMGIKKESRNTMCCSESLSYTKGGNLKKEKRRWQLQHKKNRQERLTKNKEEGDDYDWMSCKGVKWNEIISAVKWVRLACDSAREVLAKGLGCGSLKEIATMKCVWI